MSNEPLVEQNRGGKGSSSGDNNKRHIPPFDETVNIIHCCLSINSTSIYTYDNLDINNKNNNLNYVELITQKLGEINEIQEDRMDHINLNKSILVNNNKKNLNLMLYYKKKLLDNNDLITIVILCSDQMMSSFVHNLLEKIMNEYINDYYKINKQFEFKLRMKEIIELEELQLIKLIENYGSIEGEISQVREIMNNNIDKILQRGENLENLINKTSNLNTNSNSFRRRTTSIKRKMIWSNFKFIFIFSLILLIIIYVLLGIECGIPFYSRCIHPSKPNQPSNDDF
ncbi:hypothetical protein C6P40_000265 [Pichia californica]|uniref:V-SNARE coiled-coil homology domain-containing protein n=1 Tax=Pichia californica TaxID=460514 RepID=A0A9P7BE73_9ASCO|nr:hypothetical protein C6P42_003260 [[Candida] californica]KAG0688982.1 hypothetical protein C6P40_000265 [[Candida] californica]